MLVRYAEWEGGQNDYKEKMKGWLSETEDTPSVSLRNRNLKTTMLIAASILFLMALGWIFLPKNTRGLNLQEVFADNVSSIQQSTARNTALNDTLDDVWEKAMESYIQQDYKTAGLEIENLLEKLPENTPESRFRLFLGSAYLLSERPESAIQQFRQVETTSKFSDDADWYKALAFLKLGLKDSAIVILRACSTNKGHERQGDGIRILQQMGELK